MIRLVEEGKDDHVLFDERVDAVNLEIHNEWGEIFSNEALFAILAGAPPEEWQKLPGEQMARVLQGRTLTVRAHVDKFEVGEFQPVMG